MSRFPIVTNVDRDWALSQKPAGVRMHDDDEDGGEIVDRGHWLDADFKKRRHEPSWFDFVIGEVERFEKFFAGQLKSEAEWSALWRKGWWPKRRVDWSYQHMAKKEFHPFFRRGSAEFNRAMKVGTTDEQRMWERFGVAQFKPDDPRLAKITDQPNTTERYSRMMGERD